MPIETFLSQISLPCTSPSSQQLEVVAECYALQGTAWRPLPFDMCASVVRAFFLRPAATHFFQLLPSATHASEALRTICTLVVVDSKGATSDGNVHSWGLGMKALRTQKYGGMEGASTVSAPHDKGSYAGRQLGNTRQA